MHRATFVTFAACAAAALLWPVSAEAQLRRRIVPRSVVVVGAVHSHPFFHDPWFPHQYGWYPPYGHPAFDRSASLRLEVDPKHADVFIDGYWAGTVDDFDGFFQRLHLEPGEHEVELYLEGHRSLRQKVYLQPRGTFRIRHTMQPLAPGDPPDPRPVAAARPDPSTRPDPSYPRRSEPWTRSERASFGTVIIRVQPGDAEVLIDGEAWESPGSEQLVVDLPAGEHRIEVHREGFARYARVVRIRAGESATLNVSLVRE